MRAQCSVDGCERVTHSHGMCGAHAQRAREGRPLEGPIAVTRPAFDDRYVVASSGCWEWQGWLDENGYGTYRKVRAHRVSYERHVGPIPDGLVIDHLCRNPRCVNPEHLEAVTNRINMLRGVAPAANATRTNRCKRGHEFTPENTRYHTVGKGYTARECKECRRELRRETEKRRRWKKREQIAADPSLAEHGNNHTYREWMCRCQACRDAQAAYQRDRRKRRAAA